MINNKAIFFPPITNLKVLTLNVKIKDIINNVLFIEANLTTTKNIKQNNI